MSQRLLQHLCLHVDDLPDHLAGERAQFTILKVPIGNEEAGSKGGWGLGGEGVRRIFFKGNLL